MRNSTCFRRDSIASLRGPSRLHNQIRKFRWVWQVWSLTALVYSGLNIGLWQLQMGLGREGDQERRIAPLRSIIDESMTPSGALSA